MNNFTIEFKDENNAVISTSIIKRVKRAQLNDLVTFQQTLMEEMFKEIDMNDGSLALGSLLAKDHVWDTLNKVASMLVVNGQTRPGIKLKELEDDWVQLCRIFFTQSCDDNGEVRLDQEAGGYAPSLLSELHQINYRKKLGEWLMSLRQEAQAIAAPVEAEPTPNLTE